MGLPPSGTKSARVRNVIVAWRWVTGMWKPSALTTWIYNISPVSSWILWQIRTWKWALHQPWTLDLLYKYGEVYHPFPWDEEAPQSPLLIFQSVIILYTRVSCYRHTRARGSHLWCRQKRIRDQGTYNLPHRLRLHGRGCKYQYIVSFHHFLDREPCLIIVKYWRFGAEGSLVTSYRHWSLL